MLQEQQNENSDERLKAGTKDINSGGDARRCLTALAYKSVKLQQKRYCSNICQIITPILCVLFTLVTKILTNVIVSNQIFSLPYPIPFDIAPATKLVFSNPTQNNQNAHISCRELYIYESDSTPLKSEVDQFLGRVLTRRCKQENFDKRTPEFRQKSNVNQQLISILKVADLQPFQRGQDLKTQIPDGLIKFHNLSQTNLNVTFAINDFRLPQYHKNNGVTKVTLPKADGSEAKITGFLSVAEGAMSLQQKISRSFLQSINQKQIIFGNRIYMPFDGADVALVDAAVNIVGSGLYPLGLALLLPLFLYAVVSQKQDRLIQIMKMNGLNVKYYWVNFFIFNFLISVLTFSLFYIFGRYIIGLSLFEQTGFMVFWAVLLGWGVAQISLTSFVQIFLTDAKSATIVGYLLSTFSTIAGQPISVVVYPYPTPLPWYLMIYPPMTLCRAIGMIGLACSEDACFKSLFDINSELFRCIVVLFGWFFMYLASIWLNDMVQQDYGVAHRPWIIQVLHQRVCRNICCRCCFKRQDMTRLNAEIQMDSMDDNLQNIPRNQSIRIDESVYKEAEKINSLPIREIPLVTKQLSKKYDSFSSSDEDYVALKPLSIGLKNKEILGLLGPNGAGKTTLISVLTGMYPQTSGNAWIKELQIGYSSTNRQIGVCPQFDLLWHDLSVYEHLKFYALLKGIHGDLIEQSIQKFIKDFDLQEWRDTPSRELSGGMKRRLSIADSLIGNPSVVFLDQPSSGLDPGHRRQLWDILLKCKRRTSILLTTHLMEEAEVLCDRVGILDKGNLRCVGKVHDLKEKFGRGYRLTINFNNLDQRILSDKEIVSQKLLVKKIIEKYEATVVNELSSRVIFKIQKSRVFDCIKMLKQEKQISWLVSQPSLYDVFVDFVK